MEDGKICPPVRDDSVSPAHFRRNFTTLARGPAKGDAGLPLDFTDSRVVVSGLTNPTDMEFAPDGSRLFVTEDAGILRIARPDGTLSTFLDISTNVDAKGERGLLALTFNPDFSTNGYVYLHYTRKATSTTPAHNRVVRVTASGDRAVSGSEKLIFRLGNQRAAEQSPPVYGRGARFRHRRQALRRHRR